MNLSDVIARLWALLPPTAKATYYRTGDGPRLLLRRALLPSASRVMQVQGGLLQGMRMKISPRSERAYYFGTHEPDVQHALPKFITRGMTVYNVGAYIGFFTLGWPSW